MSRLSVIAGTLSFGVVITLSGCSLFSVKSETNQNNNIAEPFSYRADNSDAKTNSNHAEDTAEPKRDFHRPVEVHKRLSDYADQLAMSLIENAYNLKKTDKIAVASFVRFDTSLRQPTVLGNRLAEALMGELQMYGINIVDTKLSSNLAITKKGDLALTRNKALLAQSLEVDYIVTGTLIERPNGVEVNARIIGVIEQNVAATSNLFIPGFIVANESYYSARF